MTTATTAGAGGGQVDGGGGAMAAAGPWRRGGQVDAGAPAALTVATYNAGLAEGFVDYAAQRATPVAQALAGLDLDIVPARGLVGGQP
ncbi:MAG: hypothetical protein R3F43_18935 [bacterium]